MSSNQQNSSDKGIAMDGAPLKPLNESTPKTPQNNTSNSTKFQTEHPKPKNNG
ncbi:hypothetical protein [Mucispirillum schaedleri]|uniref:hypothetical protein n=1 Tax=Mucispirillum schaedleri TaxID=248039 RepID=UPI001F5755C9|nr:hypothetical protein [Mucispirillum schaedleri]